MTLQILELRADFLSGIMGKLKGQKQYHQWQQGRRMTPKMAILAHCYMCNGQEESKEDCQGAGACPLYVHGPFGALKRGKGLFYGVSKQEK